jgi:phage shock protein E
MSLIYSSIILFLIIFVFLTIFVFLITKNRQLLIDVRTKEEWLRNGKKGSINIPYDQIHTLNVDKSTKIVLYCNTGRRAKIARDTLYKLGYFNLL